MMDDDQLRAMYSQTLAGRRQKLHQDWTAFRDEVRATRLGRVLWWLATRKDRLPRWVVVREGHNSIECRECGADRGLGSGTHREALRGFLHNATCTMRPRKSW